MTPPSHTNDDIALFTQDELAAKLKVSRGILRQWRRKLRGPAFVRVGRNIMYRPSDVADWLKQNVVVMTTEKEAA